jgi:hypothetical protein
VKLFGVDVNAAGRRILAWTREHAFPLRLFVLHRVALAVIMYLSLTLVPAATIRGWPDYPLNRWTQGWRAWDGGWYKDLAELGYTNEPKNNQNQRDTAFFPLYPMLVAAARPLVNDRTATAGVLVSTVCFLLALVGLSELYRRLSDERTARRALILLCAYPFSFFFGAMYTESLFLATVVWSFLFAHRGRWAWAGLAAAFAGATRVVGFLLVPALLLLYLEQIEFQWRRVRLTVLGPLLGALGPLAHMAYLGWRFGDPLLFQKSQYVEGWAASSGTDLLKQTLSEASSWDGFVSGKWPTMNMLQLLALVMAAALLVVVSRRIPKAYLFWSVAMLLSSLTIWKSMGRYVTVIFPVFLGAALLVDEEKPGFQIGVFCSVTLLVLLTVTFGHFYWVA